MFFLWTVRILGFTWFLRSQNLFIGVFALLSCNLDDLFASDFHFLSISFLFFYLFISLLLLFSLAKFVFHPKFFALNNNVAKCDAMHIVQQKRTNNNKNVINLFRCFFFKENGSFLTFLPYILFLFFRSVSKFRFSSFSPFPVFSLLCSITLNLYNERTRNLSNKLYTFCVAWCFSGRLLMKVCFWAVRSGTQPF